MTVSYTSEVTSCKWLGCFLKLLLRWKGSIYKLLWLDIIIYLCMYFSINSIYRFILSSNDQKSFENFVRYCGKYANLIPLSFVLGFYVSLVMERWWNQYRAIPYPDTIAILLGSLIKDTSENARMVKRTIVRYVCLSFTMTLRMISPKVKKRFPELENFVQAGLLTEEEKVIFEEFDHEDFPCHNQYWLPLAWASNVTSQAKNDGLLPDNTSQRSILNELNKFRSGCGTLMDYDWISVPLVYTQVVTLAVYSYFLTTLISRQTLLAHEDNVIDLVFPVFTILEYFFYVGWLKVAESLINPFGDDDDDFEVIWLIDRNVHMAYVIVDQIHSKPPPLKKDKYWDVIAPSLLPYTNAARKYMNERQLPSTHFITVKDTKMYYAEDDQTIPRKIRRRHTQASLMRPNSCAPKLAKTSENSNDMPIISEENKKLLIRSTSEPMIEDNIDKNSETKVDLELGDFNEENKEEEHKKVNFVGI